jgi:hypothetical protein
VETENGQKLELTQNSEYDVINIEGLNPVGATINTHKIGVSDGEHYNSSYVNMRNIVLYIVPRYRSNDIETNRLFLYRYFRPKHKVRLYFKHDSRDVFIDGYVETVEISLYSQLEQFQISVICPQPYFLDISTAQGNFTQIENLFEFPFLIEQEGIEFSRFGQIDDIYIINNGEVETGVIISLYAFGSVSGIELYLNDTQYFKLGDLSLEIGDTLTINTNKGEKSVTLLRNGVKINCINYVSKGSTWFTLDIGENKISKIIGSGMESVNIDINYYIKYIGV